MTSLPSELDQLSNLRELYLDGSPLVLPLPEIVKQGIEAILAYLREQPNSAGGE